MQQTILNSSLRCIRNEGCKLNDYYQSGEDVIIDDDVEIAEESEPQVREYVGYRTLPIDRLAVFLGLGNSAPDLLVRVLILSNGELQIISCVFDLLWEVFREHIINTDDKTQCYERLNDHR